MHLFIILKVIQERMFCKYAYIVWLNMVYPFNGYRAPIKNAHHVYLLKCSVYVVRQRKEIVGDFLESYPLTNIPTCVYVAESERLFPCRMPTFLSGR